MTKRTKKVGITGRFGPRYGVVIRKNIKIAEEKKVAKYECTRCHHKKVRRISTGIWHCSHCDLTFAGGAYQPVYIKPKIGHEAEEAKEKNTATKPEGIVADIASDKMPASSK